MMDVDGIDYVIVSQVYTYLQIHEAVCMKDIYSFYISITPHYSIFKNLIDRSK